MKTERLFNLLEILRGRHYAISAEELAEKLNVSVRTIYRDVAALQAMGAPIEGEVGVGYQMSKGYFLPPLNFDLDEMDAIILGMQLIAVRGDGTLADAAARASSKIMGVISDRFAASRSQSTLLVSNLRGKAPNHMSSLREAIRKRYRVEMAYVDLKGQSTKRTIRPLGVTAFDEVWLLTGWCELRDDFRNFRVDRISELEMTNSYFKPELGKEFSDYLKFL
ncbi:HTH domain-containing protein [Sneathiella sp. P13V-1]|uniref:helix-turn-helix transcriptional regulator n=1 Tax=Sneathiella sp. P13V-1 TaxID=2697366 RepID=UPI00187BBDE9|nr:YafY family protein [Sneathiella sp. P13V-1]MBE7638661.1 HTH domain-containing protein [Sneathiella sp. P13V-1]